MKYLLLLLLVLGLVFLSGLRRGRRGAGTPGGAREGQSPGRAPMPDAALMVSCAECGMHLPATEAYPGKGGQFCCDEHRARFESRLGHG